MGLMEGEKVRHFWDGERRVGASVMSFWEELSSPAWDVWLLYAPGLTWGDEGAPEPSWWEHQLSDLDRTHPDRRLDAERFARKAQELASLGERPQSP